MRQLSDIFNTPLIKLKNVFINLNSPLVHPPVFENNFPPLGLAEPKHVEPALDRALKIARKNIKAITSNNEIPSFSNTIAALAYANDELTNVLTPFGEMRGSMNTKEVQKVGAAIDPKLTAFGTDLLLNEALFKRIKQVYDTVDKTTLSVEQQTLLEDTYNEFKNSGALLQGQDRETYVVLKQKLSTLGRTFSDNLTNSAGSLKLVIPAKDKARLDGIPEDIINSYAQNAKDDVEEADDSYVITMTPPPIFVLEYANDRSLRQEVSEIYKKVGSDGEFDNTQVVLDILDTRYKIAKLLGFENHADLTIRKDTRMAENYKTALDFVENNTKAYFPAAKTFYDELKAFALKKDGITDLKGSDKLYYIRLLREEQIGYDPSATRDYFEMESTLKGLFAHAEKLYGITVTEAKGDKYPKQHEDVRNYEIKDAKTGEIKALYFLDPYARKNKKSGAWMSDVRNAGLTNGKMEIPIAGNYCNYTKPSKGNPSLLTDSEVETLWHEFGHACHGMMGKGEFPSITGINTPWDYVELPSQINECWAFKPEVLATYAHHYQDETKPIPQDLVDKLQKLTAFDARWQGLRQSEMGLLDLKLHSTDPSQIKDLMDFQQKIWQDTELLPWEGRPMVLNFGHIMGGGYSAGYYSYKWADAVVADVFEQFEKQGIYNKTLCQAFKESMIEPGGTRAPSLMHKDFMEKIGQGRRDLDAQAMFRREGIKTSPNP